MAIKNKVRNLAAVGLASILIGACGSGLVGGSQPGYGDDEVAARVAATMAAYESEAVQMYDEPDDSSFSMAGTLSAEQRAKNESWLEDTLTPLFADYRSAWDIFVGTREGCWTASRGAEDTRWERVFGSFNWVAWNAREVRVPTGTNLEFADAVYEIMENLEYSAKEGKIAAQIWMDHAACSKGSAELDEVYEKIATLRDTAIRYMDKVDDILEDIPY